MHYFIILLLLLLSGCSNQGLGDAPRILGVSIEAKDICNKGGIGVPCLLRSGASGVITVNVRITGSDDTGIAGYYITHEDSLIPANWTTIAPADTTYDKTVTYSLPSGDGIKKIQVWIKDLGGKISDVTTAEVLVVSGQIKDWKKETIDEKSDFENGLFIHALRVDSNGNPHIVFGEHEMYQAVSDSAGWATEKLEGIDTGGASAGTVIDPSGKAHLSYIDVNKNLVYATNSSGSWETATVDSTGHSSGVPDIDYGNGGVHISYYDAVGKDLKYANCTSVCSDPVNWVTRVVDSTDDVGSYSAIKTGTDGGVHISYFDNTDKSLKYVTAESNGLWGDPVTVDTNTGSYSDIALDSVNKPHIAYYDRTTGILKYASNVSGNWDPVELDTDSKTANFLSIAVDAGDNVHISYYDITGLKYATNQTGAWVAVPLDTVGTSGLYNLISSDSDNNIHISYFDSTNMAVKYAVCTGGCTDVSNWNFETILSSGDAGRYNSMAMDADGNIHVSYFGGGDLRYAENTTGTWRTAAVGSSGSSGEYSSIIIDSAGTIHIGYYDSDSVGLKYAVCKVNCVKPENWTSTIIEKGLLSVGFAYVSLIVDDDDGIHISYYDIASGSLKYAFCNTDCTNDNAGDGIGDNWTRIFVDKSVIIDFTKKTDVGQYSSITLDKSSNKIYISYFERISGDLNIAECDGNCLEDSDGDGVGNNWIIETIDKGEVDPFNQSTDSRGLFTSVKVDKDGYVHISYFNETTGDLKYATNKSGDWVPAVVESYDRAGIYTALSIGADNKVYIAYYRYSVGLSVLKYAVCELNCTSDNLDNDTREPESGGDGIADNWSTYILDMFDNPGMFASVIADSDIHVIYFNPDTGGLNYTTSNEQ